MPIRAVKVLLFALTSVFLVTGFVASAAAVPSAADGTISGTVTVPSGMSAVVPIDIVKLDDGGWSDNEYGDTAPHTDSDGHYSLSVPPGTYTVIFNPPRLPGYQDGLTWTNLGNTQIPDEATLIEVGAGTVHTEANASLQHTMGTISGTIRDDSGRPLKDVLVSAHKPQSTPYMWYPGWPTVATATTNINGVYTMRTPVGPNLLHFAKPDHFSEHYPNVTSSEQAEPVEVTGGAVTKNVDVELEVIPPLNVAMGSPFIYGSGRLGSTARIVTGTWTKLTSERQPDEINSRAPGIIYAPPGTSFAYQWNRSGTPIPGATASTYTSAEPDVGRQLTVTLTASLPGSRGVVVETRGVKVQRSAKVSLGGRSPKTKIIELKARVRATGSAAAPGSVRAFCDYAGKGAINSRTYRLKNGRATIRIKAKGITSRGRTSKCFVEYYSSNGDVADGYSRNITFKMKLK